MKNINFKANNPKQHNTNHSTVEASSPYNFVPLSDIVYFPSWRKQISQDAPFKKSYSGYVEFKINAKSPIFVRNGHTQQQMEEAKEICKFISQQINNEISQRLNLPINLPKKEKEKEVLAELESNKEEWKKKFAEQLEKKLSNGADLSYLEFSNIDKKFFIPSTSVKGCIRNAIEILSYGKIGNRISDDKYGFREMTSQYLDTMNIEDIHCGYFSLQNDIITIHDHGIPYRISHTELDKGIKNSKGIRGLNFEHTFQHNYKREKMMSSFYKLNQLSQYTLPTRFKEISNLYGKKLVEINEHGNINGNIIVTGQPGKRELKYDCRSKSDKWVGKFYEFVFPSEPITQYTEYKPDSNIYQDFIFINKGSDNWDIWKNKIDIGEQIPVFFTLIDGKIRDMGLSYMYKKPYNHRISDCLYPEHRSSEKDLAECIFGVSGDTSTRGRVQFSHAFADKASFSWNFIEQLILNSPKASYYPFYIEQSTNKDGKLRYNTYLNDNSLINGWKKYPVRSGITSKMMNNPKLDTFLIPLDANSEFTCKMRFFNLKGAELGALLSALTFHDNSKEDYYHSIGQGKPYGLGKVKIEIKNLLINGKLSHGSSISNDMLIFLKTFESDFYRTTKFIWNTSENVRQFYTMSYDILSAADSSFRYLDLNDFPKIKRECKYLKRFSEVCNKDKHPRSLM